MFPDIGLDDWLAGRPESALYDLASPGFRDQSTDPEPVPPGLADRADPPAGVNAYTQLATAYGVHPEQVLLVPGARHAAFVAVAAAVTEAQERGVETPRALVEKPTAEPRVRQPVAAGAAVDRFLRPTDGDPGDPVEPGASDDHRLDPDRVAGALREGTRLVSLSDRHDPSGRLADRERLAQTVETAADGGARTLVDESQAPYPGADGPDGEALGGHTAAGLDGAVVVGSCSRFPGAGSVRVGWLVADPEFVRVARRVYRHVPGVSPPSVALAQRALADGDELAGAAASTLRENAARLQATLADAPALSGTVHPGAGVALVTHESVDGSEVSAAAWREGVLVTPGHYLGVPDAVRVGLGTDTEAFAAGLRVLTAVAANLA